MCPPYRPIGMEIRKLPDSFCSFLFYPVDKMLFAGHAHLYYYENTLMIMV
jgi:hypothetical protein